MTGFADVTSRDFELVPPEAVVAAARAIEQALSDQHSSPAELATFAVQAMRPVLGEHLMVMRILAAISADLFGANCRRQETIDRVEAALFGIESGDHATAGRDYGRGIAYAARLIREALAESGEVDHDQA